MAMGESGDCTMYGPRAHNVTVEGLAQLIMGGSVRIDAACAARVLATIMEGHIEVGDASHYIYHFARKQGWDIPAYPLAGCGEIKRFFAVWKHVGGGVRSGLSPCCLCLEWVLSRT